MRGEAEYRGEAEWQPSANPWMIALALVAASFIEVLDTTIVSVAQPNVAGSLGATNDEASWVLTSYLVANAIILPASSWLSLRFGRKQFLMACTVLFTAASFLCGLAPTMGALVLARILQGAGGGALLPLSQTILLESFPREKQGQAMAVFGLGVVVAPILGPFVGGWITDHYSWRWVFNINVPVGMIALALMARYIEDPPYIKQQRPGTIDALGFGLLAVWLGTLQVVLDKGQQEDWFSSSYIVWLSVISVSAFAGLLIRELRTAEPVVDLHVFRDRNFWVGSTMTFISMAGMYSALTILPLFLQTLMGYTAQNSGLATAPRGLGAMLAMPIAGLLMAYVDSRWLISAGVLFFTVSTRMFASLTLDVSMTSIIWPNVLQGLGLGLILVPLMTVSVGTLPKEKMGNASGLFNLMRNLGGSIGISIATTFLARMAQAHQVNLAAHLTPYDPMVQQRAAAISAGLHQPVTQAYAMLYRQLLQQASMNAYIDVFSWTAVIVAVCLPGAWLLRRVMATVHMPAH